MKRRMISGAALGAMLLGSVSMAESAPDAAKTGAVTPSALSDAQIAGIVVAANKAEIEAGKMAASMAKDPQVKQYGEQMATDHKKVTRSTEELTKKLGVKPIDSDSSKALKTSCEQSATKLKKLKGAEFDKTYIEDQIATHEKVIDTMEKTLIPGAQNPELKAALQEFKPAFVAHLNQAKQIKSQLGGTEPAMGGSGTSGSQETGGGY